MSFLALSLSHQSAPFEILERATLTASEASDLAREITELDHVRESLTLATCNRVELYVATEAPEETIADTVALLSRHSTLGSTEVRQHARVLIEDEAISHVFRLAAGLESMVLGEGQVLGQLRDALTRSQLDDTVGPELNAIMQQALRAGKRAHAETGIDRFAPSVVTAALAQVGARIDETGNRFLITGAGTMSVLAVVSLLERGVRPELITVSNRALGRALDLAEKYGVTAVRWEALDKALLNADVLITCTGATDVIFDAARLAPAIVAQLDRGAQFTILDLALPRDVGPDVRALEGVTVVDLATLANGEADQQRVDALAQVEAIVDWEIAGQLAARRHALVMPTVVALREKAREIVDAEFMRVESRLAGFDEQTRSEVKSALQRVAQKLIHAPTVRLKELSEAQKTEVHTDTLATLFELNPGAWDEPYAQAGEVS